MSEEYNRYVAARHEWDERYGGLLNRIKNLRLALGMVTAVAIIEGLGWYRADARTNHVPPFVAVVDGQGRFFGGGYAGTSPTTDGLKRSNLQAWVESLRLVTTDATLQRNAITAVYNELGDGSAAQNFVSEYYRGHDPRVRSKTETAYADVTAVLPTSDRTYEVDWTETTRDLYGGIKSTEHWKASLLIAVNAPADEAQARRNSLGIYVQGASWSKVL
jgi:type IV secretion system protein TrbF